ncbi:hypothetical protein MCP1_50078 [Candidatus Terasakiella magnetica]|nr:hypothetical protein MCP1_50078 [Candidatus Terasakiella magnetica]
MTGSAPTIRLLALGSVAILAVIVVLLITIGITQSTLLDEKRSDLRDLAQIGLGVLAHHEAERQAGRMSESQAKDAALAIVAELHRPSGSGLWLLDRRQSLLLPANRSPRSDRNLALALIGERMGKPGFQSHATIYTGDRLSYAAEFQPWGWTIGAALPVNDLDAANQNRLELSLAIAGMAVGLIVLIGVWVGKTVQIQQQ